MSTAEAYAWYDEDRTAGLQEPRELQMLPVPWPTRAAQMINDLEPPVVRRHPEIGDAQVRAARGGRGGGGDVGKRIGGFRPVSQTQLPRRVRVKPLAKGGSQRVADANDLRAPNTSGALVPLPKSAETG